MTAKKRRATVSGPGRMGSTDAVRKSLKGSSSRFIKVIKSEDSITVRLLDEPEDWEGYYEHFVNGRYQPCITDECDGCDSDDPDEQRKSFKYLANAYVVDDQKVMAVKMPKTLVEQLMNYEKIYTKKGQSLLDRDFDFSRTGSGQFDTKYTATPDERDVRDLSRFDKKKHDLHEILDAMVNGEVEIDKEEEPTSKKKSSKSEPKRRPKDDDPWDDDDEDDDDEPVVRRRSSSKKSPGKKTVKKSSVKRRVRR